MFLPALGRLESTGGSLAKQLSCPRDTDACDETIEATANERRRVADGISGGLPTLYEEDVATLVLTGIIDKPVFGVSEETAGAVALDITTDAPMLGEANARASNGRQRVDV